VTRADGSTRTPRPQGRRAYLIVALAGAAVYLNSLPNGFTYDDVPIIVTNPVTQPEAAWHAPWTHPYWPGSDVNAEIDVLYRPLTVMTYALQRKWFGDRPLPFHAGNVVLHAVVCAGVCWLARRLGCGAAVATLVGVVFAVHPIHCEAVANVVGRAELLAAGGGLLALWAADRWCDRLAASPHRGWLPGPWLGVVAGFFLALTSKESGVATAAMVILWIVWRRRSAEPTARASGDRTGGHDADPQSPRGRVQCVRPALRHWVWIAMPMAVILAAYLLARYQVCGFRLSVGGQRVGPGNPLREGDVLERLLTPVSLVGRYVALMARPARLLLDYSLAVLPATRSILEPYFLVGAAALVLMVRWAVRSWKRRGAGWLVVAGLAASYAATSNTFLQIDIIFAERFFYSPSIWLCVTLGLLIEAVLASAFWRQCRPAVRTLARVGLVVGVGALAVRTLVRNPNWVDNATIYAHDLEAMTPGSRSANILSVVGRRELEAGNYEAAEAHLREAIAAYDAYPEFHLLLGRVYMETGRWVEALAALEQAQRLGGRNMEIATTLERARRMAAGADVEGELAAGRQAARAQPDSVDAVRRWALAAEVVDPAEAVEAYQHWVRLRPDAPDVIKGLAYAQAAAADPRGAVESLRRVIELSSGDWEAHTNLSVLLIDRLDAERYDCAAALRHARRAVDLNATHWQVNVNLAEVLAACGDPQEAATLFDQLAAQCPPGSADRRLYEERARFLRGR